MELLNGLAYTIGALLREGARRLAATSPTPRLDAELLLAHLLGWGRARLLAEADAPVAEAVAAEYARLLERRAELVPVAYLTGHKEFYGLEFAVDARVLVPRPETELLVEQAIAWAAKHPRPLAVADIGTGSGAIAVALAKHLPAATVYAVDLSPAALEVARANATRHGVAVQFFQGDLLASLPRGQIDILISNPPYTLLDAIDPGVRRHEPQLALDGGPDGLDVYRRLLRDAPAYLKSPGMLLLELGAGQDTAVGALARDAFPLARLHVHHDLAGIARVLAVELGPAS
jgi:release factor glutamine methyltransferase